MNPIFIAASNTILDASKNSGFGQFLQAVISYVCLAIDSIVYFVVTIAYKIFLALSQFELFNDEAFEYLINRAYIIIGVISLFLVAYSLLNAIINPENSAKGKNSVSKTVKNVVIAIIGVAIVPTLFNYFYYFQRVILCNNLIPRLLLEQVDTGTTNLNNAATELSELIFESFFYPNSLVSGNESTGSTEENSSYEDDDVLSAASGIVINESNPEQDSDTYSLAEAYDNAKNGVSFWRSFSPFIFSNPGVSSNDIQYLIILSTIAGGYIAYIFINLCLDMGLRVVKLGYLELIAPLAIMTTIVPGQDGVFKNWSKKTISCAIEVFTRLFVVVFAVYLVSTIKDVLKPSLSTTVCGLELNPFLILIMRAIIYIAIFTFVKHAPKFFSEATGIKSDGFKLGLTDKMKESGILQGLGAVGGGITAGVRNMAPGVAKGFANGGVLGAIGGGIKSIPSGLAGVASGTRRGWSNTKDVKKWSDVRDGAGKAADEAMEAKLKRQDYKDAHGGTFWGAAGGHAKDAISSLGDWVNAPEATYKHAKAQHDKLSAVESNKKELFDFAKELRSDEKYKTIFKDENGKSLRELELEKSQAEKFKDETMKEYVALQKQIGLDKDFSEEGIARQIADTEQAVQKASQAKMLARNDAELRIANENYQRAVEQQGLIRRLSQTSNSLNRANENAANAAINLSKAEDYIDKSIVNGNYLKGPNAEKDLADKVSKYDNLVEKFDSSVKDATSVLNNDDSETINDYLNDVGNNNVTDVAKIFKNMDTNIINKMNQYGEAIRKKSEGKK